MPRSKATHSRQLRARCRLASRSYTQISRKEFEVTGTAQKVDNAGMKELLGYHTARAGKEIKRDVELTLLSATTSRRRVRRCWRGRPAGAQKLRVIPTTTSRSASRRRRPRLPRRLAFAGAVTAGTSSALTETDLKSGLQQAWSCGGEVTTICVGPTLYNSISAFTGLATRFRDVGASAGPDHRRG